MKVQKTKGYEIIDAWLTKKGFTAFEFQVQTWERIHLRESGLVNAPTGCGKTFSVYLGTLIQFINQHPNDFHIKKKNGFQLIESRIQEIIEN
jgi:ATP-dependent Lhr-like helicase